MNFDEKIVRRIAYIAIQPTPFQDKHITLSYFGKKSLSEKLAILEYYYPILYNSISAHFSKVGFYQDKNFGYFVELNPDFQEKYFQGIVPHMTILVQNGGRAVDTWKCFSEFGQSTDIIKIPFGGIVYPYKYNNKPVEKFF